MTLVAPLTLAHVKATEAGARLASVAASGYSGLEIAGTLGGIVGSLAAVVALVISVAAGNAKRRRQYDQDLHNAKEDGRKEMREAVADELAELREIRTRYFNMLEGRGGSHVLPPPSMRPRPDVSPDEV